MLVAFFLVAALWSANAHSAEPIAEERIIDLPQDAEKWFVSVVGDAKDPQFLEVIEWFSKNKNLADLKGQVHFWKITSDSAAFKERYSHNVESLPTVRVQKHDGSIVWEGTGGMRLSSDKSPIIPWTAAGLYREIASASANAIFPLLPWRRSEPYLPVFPLRKGGTPNLPWRKQMDERCGPDVCPAPVPVMPDFDYLPPPLDDGGPPVLKNTGPSIGVAIGLALLSAIAGGGFGVIQRWKAITETE